MAAGLARSGDLDVEGQHFIAELEHAPHGSDDIDEDERRPEPVGV